DRPKHLFAVGRRFLWHVDKNSRLVEESGAVNPIAASQRFCAYSNRFLDLIVHALQDVFSREWTELSRFIHGIACLEGSASITELIKKLVVNFVCNHKSLCRNARLAGVDGARFSPVLQSGSEFGVRLPIEPT